MRNRIRIDDPRDLTYTEDQQRDPELMIDRSETPIAPQIREDDPPELNKDAGKAVKVELVDPTPVRIVESSDSDYRARVFHGFTATCSAGIIKQIAAASDHRTRITLFNNGGSGTLDVSIGSSAEEARADGYPLSDGQQLVIEATCAIWGYVRSTTTTDYVNVGVLPEYAWPRK